MLGELIEAGEDGNKWAEMKWPKKSGLREVEEHYFGQLTKDEIRELYLKYKMDFEVFGFEPDYYIAMGLDELPESD